MKNAKSTKRLQLVGALHGLGVTDCPCCHSGMYMQGVERVEAFKARHAAKNVGRTPGKRERLLATATIDHVVPKASGGTDRWDNLVVMCRGCNDEKHSLSVPEWIMFRRNVGRPFKKITEGYLLALHIKATNATRKN